MKFLKIIIKKIISKSKYNEMLLKIRFLTYFDLRKISGRKKKYPKVIQLPLTYACNSKCVMCNIWKMDHTNELSIEEFSNILRDPIFKEVNVVGINGGEPSLIKNLHLFAEQICKLPSLTSLNIISHGFNDKKLTNALMKIYEICKSHEKKFHISISLDGTEHIHNKVRGKDVFHKTFSTIMEIKNNQYKYCDSFDLGCTIIKQNVDYLIELDSFLKINNLDNIIRYRLGIDNKRIESDKIKDQYSVIYSTTDMGYSAVRQSAKEFILGRMNLSKTIQEKYKYFSLFYWLNSTQPKRLLGCNWQEEGATLDARGKLYYCAVNSEEIGDLRNGKKGEDIFFSDKNLKHREDIIKNKCDTCIHDYTGINHISSMFIFIKFLINKRYAMKIYRFKGLFL